MIVLILWLSACNVEKPPLTTDTADTAIVWSASRTLRGRLEPVVVGLRDELREGAVP